MPIPQAVLRMQHDDKIIEISDTQSRFSFKYKCSCGVEGLFYTRIDAERYQAYHLRNKGIDVDAQPST